MPSGRRGGRVVLLLRMPVVPVRADPIMGDPAIWDRVPTGVGLMAVAVVPMR